MSVLVASAVGGVSVGKAWLYGLEGQALVHRGGLARFLKKGKISLLNDHSTIALLFCIAAILQYNTFILFLYKHAYAIMYVNSRKGYFNFFLVNTSDVKGTFQKNERLSKYKPPNKHIGEI